MNENTEKNQSIGTRLLTLRNESNLTQEELAEKLDVSRQSISKWELNKTLPDVEKLIQLSDMYQVSMDYLIKGKKEEEEKLCEEEQEICAVPEREHLGKKGNRWDLARKSVLVAGMCLSGVLCLCMFIFAGRLLFKNTFQRENKSQDVIWVDKIYEQYTKAQVAGMAENGELYKEIVWLDIPGLNEEDYIFCYRDVNHNEQVSFEYYSKTLILPIVAGIIFLTFFVVFLLEWNR